jgi:hypothetical protein
MERIRAHVFVVCNTIWCTKCKCKKKYEFFSFSFSISFPLPMFTFLYVKCKWIVMRDGKWEMRNRKPSKKCRSKTEMLGVSCLFCSRFEFEQLACTWGKQVQVHRRKSKRTVFHISVSPFDKAVTRISTGHFIVSLHKWGRENKTL